MKNFKQWWWLRADFLFSDMDELAAMVALEGATLAICIHTVRGYEHRQICAEGQTGETIAEEVVTRLDAIYLPSGFAKRVQRWVRQRGPEARPRIETALSLTEDAQAELEYSGVWNFFYDNDKWFIIW